MYEMFTGALPFAAESYIDLVNKHLFAAPPPPRERNPDIPDQLEGLILRCMAKDPQQRPESMKQLLSELESLKPSLRGTRISVSATALPAPSPEQGASLSPVAVVDAEPEPAPQRRSRWGWLVGGVAALAAVVLAAVLLVIYQGRGAEMERASAVSPLVELGRLKIVTKPPGATVVIDGQKQAGRSPLIAELAPGSYEVRVALEGHKEATGTVELEVGKEQIASYTLAPEEQPKPEDAAAATGQLVVSTGHSKARYRVDGEEVGTGRRVALDLPAGEHTLVVDAPRMRTIRRKIDLRAGGTEKLELKLVRQRRGRPFKRPGKGPRETKTHDPDQTLDPFKRRRRN
jgi:hypothetical protein